MSLSRPDDAQGAAPSFNSQRMNPPPATSTFLEPTQKLSDVQGLALFPE